MRYEQACHVADVLPVRNPCMEVIMLGRATDMLADLGAPIPAWTIPADSWLVILHHAGEDGECAIGHAYRDTAVMAALRAAGQYIPRQNGKIVERRQRATLYTWRCPIHSI